MPINSASIPALRVARAVKRRRRAEGGGVDDWREREAQLGLAIQQQQDQRKQEDATRTWGDTARDVAGFPRRLIAGLSQPMERQPQQPSEIATPGAAFGALSPGEEAASSPPGAGTNIAGNLTKGLAEAVHSGVTAPGDAMSGKLPMYDQEGRTSPEAVRRGFDLASVAGGASAAGTAERAATGAGTDFRVMGRQMLASDSGKPAGALAAGAGSARREVNPGDLIFRESMQNRIPEVAGEFPKGEGYPPIVTIETRDGPLILDGHNRAAVASSRGDSIPSVSISEREYKALKDAGYDDMEISYAALTRAGEDEQASAINRQFPGSSVAERGTEASSLLDDIDQIIAAERNLKGPTNESAAVQATAAPEAAGDVGGGLAGPAGGGASLDEAARAAERWAGQHRPIEGFPVKPQYVEGHGYLQPGPIGRIRDVSEEYMRTHRPEIEYAPPGQFHPIDPERAKAVAQAYEEMKHTPNDPATKASYEAMIDETKKQYDAIKSTGLKIEPIPPGAPDPYAANPRLAAHDVAENNHLWFFPTEGGFGTVNKITDNPLLRKMGEKIGDHEMTANDMFRVVHDYFGHLKEGHGFRAVGEDNAWRSHSAMYSDLARPAMTSETRGQNSWVNYGPHGEKNRTASGADTVYADQKVGLLPDWTMYDKGKEPIAVFHGSPHTKIDRFSSDKIGTGEGNQAYGHGLYMAGAEPVSERYRHALSVMQDPLLKKYGLDDVGHVIGNHLADAGGDAQKLASEYTGLRNSLIQSQQTDKATKNAIKEYDRRIKFLLDPERNKGAMYRVGLEADPQHILSYDDVLRQQTPYVQERVGPPMEESAKRQVEHIKRVLKNNTTGVPGGRFSRPLLPGARAGLEGRLELLEQHGADSLKGNEVYKRLGLPAKNENEASVRAAQRLREMGIPAMKYLDSGSRGMNVQMLSPTETVHGQWLVKQIPNGETLYRGADQAAARAAYDAAPKPTHNFVVFDDNMLRILRRYGIAGIPAAGVLGAGEGNQQYARGGSVNPALNVARRIKRAKGGKVHIGPIVGSTDGRADKVPMQVPDSCYVLTADHVSGMGEGNTAAGFQKLSKMFPKSKPSLMRGMKGRTVPVYCADGEFVVNVADIKDRWGDVDKGHRVLDHWQTSERKKLIETLKGLAPPAQD